MSVQNIQGIQQINKLIEQLIARTEKLYGAIFAELPKIEQDIQMNIEEMNIMLNYFLTFADQTNTNGDDNAAFKEEGQQIAKFLKRIEREFSDKMQKMFNEAELRTKIERFLSSQNGNQNDTFQEFVNIIHSVHQHITSIEIISINALIHSTHLGEKGKAFGVISANIQKFSNDLKATHAQMEKQSQKLYEWNDEFIEQINLLLNDNMRLREEKFEQFTHLFKEVFESLDMVGRLLKEVNVHIEGALLPIQELMIAIQKQDIIRQSLENVTKCLNLTAEGINEYNRKSNLTKEEELNYVTFIDEAITITVQLVGSVETLLKQSLAEIENPITSIHQTLLDRYEDSKLVAELLSGGEDNTVKQVFLRVRHFLSEFHEKLVLLTTDLDRFSQIDAVFELRMSEVESQLAKIKSRMPTLKTLNILSQIELARLDASLAAFGEDISKKTEIMVTEVDLNETIAQKLRDLFRADLHQFQQMIGENKEVAQMMTDISNRSLENFEMVEQLVVQAIQPISNLGKQLLDEMANLDSFVKKRSDFDNILLDISENLSALHTKFSKDKERLYTKYEITAWENENVNLNEILAYLTTHYERMAVNDALDREEVEVGDSGGELTLF